MNVDITKRFNHISLCAGYGGIDLGLARVIRNLRTIAYSEIEFYAIENLVSKMEKGMLESAPIWTNLKTFPFSKFRGQVDILSGGFPCQPFSAAGKREADSDPRHLFPYIKQGIIECRPAFVFLENVKGIANSNIKGEGWGDPKGTPILLHLCRELERIGYESEWGFFSAREVGLPHNRDRVVIMGKRNDIDNTQLEEFTKYLKRVIREEPYSISGREEIYIEDIKESDNGIEKIESRRICRPSFRNEQPYSFEPPRTLLFSRSDRKKVLDDTNGERPVRCDDTESSGLCVSGWDGVGQAGSEDFITGERVEEGREDGDQESPFERVEYEVGGDGDGITNRLDYERLQKSFTNLHDEMRLLGNGVVPATMEKAFRVLFEKFLGREI